MTEVVRVDRAQPADAAIARAAACLARGGLVAFPTETVYGLGVHACDPEAVRRLFNAKQRPANDPLIVHVARFDQIAPLVDRMPPHARELADRFWPGPLTIVMPRSPLVPDEVTAGLPSVAIRIPAHPVARALLEEAAIPVAAPSANLFSRPSPTESAHVLQDLDGRIDMVLDGGPTDFGIESTVLSLAGEPPLVLRPGAVTVEMLRDVVPAVQLRRPPIEAEGTPLPSPGLLARHYAPQAPLTLFAGNPAACEAALADEAQRLLADNWRVGVLATDRIVARLSGLPVVLGRLGSGTNPYEIAARLYAALRELDAAGVDTILACGITRDQGLWRALADRLRRAAVRTVAVR